MLQFLRRPVTWFTPIVLLGMVLGCGGTSGTEGGSALTDAQLEDLVRRSYQYVAMYNVNNKFAMAQGGWNTVVADTQLKDHTLTDIARPNNDTLYISCLLDLRAEPFILEIPAFESDYASLMITGYDHYVNVPMTSRNGDFREPEQMIVYSARSGGFDGGPVEGIGRSFEATGDFVSAVFRVMPHASDPERFDRIVGQMQQVKAYPLSTQLGTDPGTGAAPEFPEIGATDADVFGNNLLEVMQFVFNHTTFDPEDPIDAGVLAVCEPLGVVPGRDFDPEQVTVLDGARVRATAERIAAAQRARATDPEFKERSLTGLFQPKGKMTLELLVFQSVIGPIGLPADEAIYPALRTTGGQPMNAQHDYRIRMAPDAMPPAGAFWSITLYDAKDGFFIPNPRKKYSVGANAGMQLDADGGITIYIAAEQPDGAPLENWLPIERKDVEIGPILRMYVPDLEAAKVWEAPLVEEMET
jgi:hypothetical protein